MDPRVVKTLRSINNAFIMLRSRKETEKITIRELCEVAEINKATFYQHYHDIYHLESTLQEELVTSILDSIPHPEMLVTEPALGISAIITAIFSEERLISILFPENRLFILRNSLEKRLKEAIIDKLPNILTSLENDILLSIMIQGSFDAYFSHKQEKISDVIHTLIRINSRIIEALNY